MNQETKKRLKILHVAYWFTTSTIDLVNEQAKDHDVMYITTRSAVDWMSEDEWREMFDPRIKVRVERDRLRRNPLYYTDRIIGMYNALWKFKPDIMHIQWPSDHFLNHLFVKWKKTPIVFNVHDPVPHLGERMHAYKQRESLILELEKRADRIIVHGQGVKNQLLEVNKSLDPDRVAVVLHVAMNFMLRWNKPEYKEKAGEILFFGRINEYKGLGVLLDAWQLVKESVPEAKLVVAGTGYDLPNYRDRIINDPRCELIEKTVPTPEVTKLFAEASIVVMPYLEGTQSGPLAISVAFGKPVVITDVGGLPEMVDRDKSGFIVPPRDPKALADAIIKILKDDELRANMKKRSLEIAQNELSPKIHAEQVEKVYRDAIEHHKAIKSKQ
jgi:glycosyltransferase involved in cell wall biosynthesis